MTKTETTYWRLRLGETPAGLFVRVEEDGVPVRFVYLGEEGWVDDPTLFRWWLDPGDHDLVQVDRETAAGVALAAGFELE